MSYLNGSHGSDEHIGAETPSVVAICGSLRAQSKTRVAVTTALAAAEEAGAATTLLDLRRYDLPPYNYEEADAGDAATLKEIVDDADSIILGTPNYHGSVSGVLKNALDYLGRDQFEGETVGLLEVAGGEYPGSALRHLREVARTLNAWTLPVEVAVPSSRRTIQDGAIEDPEIERRVRLLGENAVEYAHLEERVAHAERVPAED